MPAIFLRLPDLKRFWLLIPASVGSASPKGAAGEEVRNMGGAWHPAQETGTGPPPGGGGGAVMNICSPAASSGVNIARPCFTRSYLD